MKLNLIHLDLDSHEIPVINMLKLSKLNDLRFGRNADLYRLNERSQFNRDNRCKFHICIVQRNKFSL